MPLHSLRLRLRLIGPLLGCALLAPSVLVPPAQAQGLGAAAGPGGTVNAARRGSSTPEPARQADPAALPGAKSRVGAAPLTRAPSEMGPTEALFDAVNRGDIGAARDAVSRGADLNEHNLLGLTALELAVDLGNNDIAFLLLSLRGGEGPSGTAKPTRAASAPAGSQKGSTLKGPSPRGAARAVAADRPPAATPVRSAPARQYGSDGGAPIPNAGFLGFGPGR